MNPRTTVILLAIAAALGAFIWFYEIQGESGRQEAADLAARLFPDVEQDAIVSIALGTTDGQEARLVRSDSGWELETPVQFPADQFAADGLASGLATLTSEARYELRFIRSSLVTRRMPAPAGDLF